MCGTRIRTAATGRARQQNYAIELEFFRSAISARSPGARIPTDRDPLLSVSCGLLAPVHLLFWLENREYKCEKIPRSLTEIEHFWATVRRKIGTAINKQKLGKGLGLGDGCGEPDTN